MKTSFSLSSLQGFTPGNIPSPPTPRLCNSLTKKRKQSTEYDSLRRCGSMSRNENKDEFWAALQPNYNYIMDNQLIDTCTETNGEIESKVGDMRSFTDLATSFSELYSWLNRLQEMAYERDETKGSCTRLLEELKSKSYRRSVFIEQASRLSENYPEIKEEVNWRITHLNSKWEAVVQAISLAGTGEKEMDIDHEIRCLRKWMHDMESRLQPLTFRHDWTFQELEAKSWEHMVLHRDVESHGKIVNSVLKLCNSTSGPTSSKGRRVAAFQGLERRWHLLYLRSLEWQCHIETLWKRFSSNSNFGASTNWNDSESDDEPVHKQPRLSSSISELFQRHVSSSSSSSANSDNELSSSSDSDGESYFEDGIVETCVLVRNTSDYLGSRYRENSKKPSEMSTAPQLTSVLEAKPQKLKISDEKPRRKSRNKLIPTEESALTTKIDYNGPNNVTYYCQHRDTDSADGDTQTTEQSSDEEWTFTNTKNQKNCDEVDSPPPDRKPLQPQKLNFSSPVRVISSPKLSKDELTRLVEKAEIMVSTPLVSTPAKTRKPIVENLKYRRVTEWLNRSTSENIDSRLASKVDDNCDASGEYTTGESDAEKESQSSEELNGSIATFRQVGGCTSQATSIEVITEMESNTTIENVPFNNEISPITTKVNLRTKRNQNKSNRPWSVACISALMSPKTSNQPQNLNNFSISESALHELAIASMSVRAHLTCSANNVGTPTQIPATTPDTHFRGSLHRKKLRARKSNRKSDSISDSSNERSIVKSGSFSGAATSRHSISNERYSVSDPNNTNTAYVTSQASGLDSDDDRNKKILSSLPLIETHEVSETKPVAVFKLGALVTTTLQSRSTPNRDSSPEKNSLNTCGTEEQLSSLSEWDNYLEKYMSEPYSETPDSEAARRLLEFGEDYRNYLDSQSDCCSSLSAKTQSQSPAPVRRWTSGDSTFVAKSSTQIDSESDMEECRHVIRESRAVLYLTNEIFTKALTDLTQNPSDLQNDFSEIVATCRENLHLLQILLKNQGTLLSTSELRDVKALVGSWSSIQMQASELQKVKVLDKQILLVRTDLMTLVFRTVPLTVQSRQELDVRMNQTNMDLAMLEDRKRNLLHINVAVRRFLSDSSRLFPVSTNGEAFQMATEAISGHLKDRVTDLYRLWTETFDGLNDQLASLKNVFGIWSQFDTRLTELQGALRSDFNTLQMLNTALADGAITADVVSSVRDVAKVLSEKPHSQTSSGNNQNGLMKNVSLIDGSFSDSGISDEGSEQDLSERERRLAVLRRLVRQLESALTPGSHALMSMEQRIEQTESELRDLQRTCHDLIVRTAVCAEGKIRNQDLLLSKRKLRKIFGRSSSVCPGGDPDDEPGRWGRPWLWRVMRASFPFQLALVAIFCVACLLEPHCCDRINNLSMSLSPQLRYVKGPPPV